MIGESGWLDFFLKVLGNWQMLALCIIAVLLVYRVAFRKYYEQLWNWAPWSKRWALMAVAVLAVIQIRELLMFPFSWIDQFMPTYSLADQLFFYLGNIHVRSITFYGILIFWQWRKMKNLLPAVVSAWFWIGLIELTFIPQHLLWGVGFLGVNHYAPFVCLMLFYFIERKRFEIPRSAWNWFFMGIFLQYFCLLFEAYSVVQMIPGGGGFTINPKAVPDPHPFTYLFDLMQHGMKTLFTVAAAQTNLRKSARRIFPIE